ncbi:hypothetical protein GGR51DRAFT_537144 [Nemania sp. FL0031]|nr:hypothetical protein GGR51DRAFT_537144 [Nemania sp. FL0031]
MMDGLSVAAAVIQFVDFTCGLISKGIAIHSSATGLTVDHNELQNITEDLSQTSNDIKQSLINQHGERRLTSNEEDLQKIARDCQVVAEELLGVLATLTSKGHRTKWRSFRHALETAWKEKKVQSLENRLDRFRQQMMANVLNSLRHETRRLIQEQSSMRESVRRIEQLQLSVGDRFVDQLINGEEWKRDLIQMIHEQGQRTPQRTADPTRFKGDRRIDPGAIKIQELVQRRVLHKLTFRNMADRESRISRAHQRTFEWVFSDPHPESRPWSSFRNFLKRPGKKIYWITGKPGSGKSTLMKYIRYHPQTENLLRMWCGNDEFIQASFYFWNSGSRMQMTVDGLLQTLLHDCLRQLPQAIRDVLPERWEAATLFEVDDFPWSWEEVAQALRRLLTEICPEKKFFIMIDGLDECSGNQAQLIELITELAEGTENLKLCVASRPWNIFEDAFKDRPSLRVQDLSAPDIKYYIESKFAANQGFAEFREQDPSCAMELLETIAKKAEGVFLWVYLVVQSLLEGLTNGDGPRDLLSRLEELPPNLEQLYAKILGNLGDRYLDHASRLFQLVRACEGPPTLLCIALADLEDGERAIQAPVKPMSDKEKSSILKNMKRKLASRCLGLLEVPSMGIDSHTSGAEDEVIQYLHKSVRDYIQSSDIWSWLVSVTRKPFDPHLLLFKSCLLQLKSYHSDSHRFKMRTYVLRAILYAKRSLNAHKREKTRHAKKVVHLLDEMDRTITLLYDTYAIRHPSVSTDLSKGKHWSCIFLSNIPNPSFLHMMVVGGIHQYLEMKLSSSDLKEEDRHRNSIEEGYGMPLMIAALKGPLSDDGRRLLEVEDLLGPHPEVFKTLLQKGESCHKRYDTTSAWDLVKEMSVRDYCHKKRATYATILKLFEEYMGKPRRVISDKESNVSTEAVSGDSVPQSRRSRSRSPRPSRQPRVSRSRRYKEPFLPSSNTRRRYDDDSDEEYYYHPFSHQSHDTRTPPSRHPASYWSPSMPMLAGPLYPPNWASDYSGLPYYMAHPPYASYRSGWPGGPPPVPRSYDPRYTYGY